MSTEHQGRHYCTKHDVEVEYLMPFRTIAVCKALDELGHIVRLYGLGEVYLR